MKQKKYCIRNLIVKLISCVMVSFLILTSYVIPKKENYTVHADTYTPVQKQSFVTWLLSYFGINIYTDAQQISDDLYTAVKLAYDAYLATLQPQQQIGFDDIADLVTWDNARPNVLKLPGTVYNVLKGFANYISSQVYDPSNVQGLEIGTYETPGIGTYTEIPNDITFKSGQYDNQGTTGYYYFISSKDIRAICFTNSTSPRLEFYYVSLQSFKYNYNSSTNPNYVFNSYDNQSSSETYNGVTYYYVKNTQYTPTDPVPYVQSYPRSGNDTARRHMAFDYTFGSMSDTGEGVLNDVYALPKPAVLDDLIGAADPEDDMQLDLDGSDIAYSTALTLEDIIGMINDAVNGYVLDDSYPDTAAKIAAQSQAIDNELTDIDYPNASNWEVPQSIATPQIIPLIQPECPDLSACLVAGIQDVGTSLGNVIEANSNVSNYVSVILFMGIALAILGGI